MFTGIIEHVGTIASAAHRHESSVLEVDIGLLSDGTKLGDSIATDGVCLTVTSMVGSIVTFDVSAETRRSTTLPGWRSGGRGRSAAGPADPASITTAGSAPGC